MAKSVLPGLDTGIFDQLLWLFKEMAKFQLLYPLLAQIGYRAINSSASLPEEITTQAATSTRQYFTSLIEEGKKRGEVRPEVDPEITAFVFTSALTELTPYLTDKLAIEKQAQTNSAENNLPLDKVEEVYVKIIEVLRLGISPRA
jgi:hypothetical protein